MDEVNVGDVIVYACKPGFAQTGGDLIHMCLPSGTFTGTPPMCRRKLILIKEINVCFPFIYSILISIEKEN